MFSGPASTADIAKRGPRFSFGPKIGVILSQAASGTCRSLRGQGQRRCRRQANNLKSKRTLGRRAIAIVVELSDGKKYPAAYRPRPPMSVHNAFGLTTPSDNFWTAAWLIPQDYPTGSLSYRVVATDMQGNTQEWTPFKDLRSLPVVMPGDVEYTK